MRKNKAFVWLPLLVPVGIVVGCAALGVASRFIFKKTDNVVEEAMEKVIENKTGWRIDLSPDTPDTSVPERKPFNISNRKIK
jgi:hypothetical protein